MIFPTDSLKQVIFGHSLWTINDLQNVLIYFICAKNNKWAKATSENSKIPLVTMSQIFLLKSTGSNLVLGKSQTLYFSKWMSVQNPPAVPMKYGNLWPAEDIPGKLEGR